mmetsp:Transcript_5262/g.15375  ORF Transcript_5262/g.15375 Transcript_5262/m.15375 type:complete len:214 (-) Transcript_5262:33-674(-)
MNLVLEDHVSVVVEVEGLDEDSHEGNHGQSSVVDLLVLVVDPAIIGVIDPVGGSQKVSGLVSWALLDLLGQPLDGAASQHELDPSDGWELLGGLQRVVAQFAVEGWVDAGGVEVPSQAGGHGDASVLQFGLAVVVHGVICLVFRQTERIEVSHRRCDSDDGILLPCLHGCGGGLLLGWGEGGGRADEGGENGELHHGGILSGVCMYLFGCWVA